MNPLLNKEPVKRAENSIKEFDPNLKIICLEQTARTAEDAATALGCNVGAIVKSLLFSTGDSFVLCLVSGDQRCSLNKLKKIKSFILDGDKTKITVRFRGREILNSSMGLELLNKLSSEISDIAQIDQEPSLEGKQLIMVLSPLKKK